MGRPAPLDDLGSTAHIHFVCSGISVAKLSDLFPGNLGRLKLIRVMLRVGMPQLSKMNPATDLDPQLEALLRQALRDVEQG